jgi:hypothetical protein
MRLPLDREIRELSSDPGRWRAHLVCRLRSMLQAELVISSEVHVRVILGQGAAAGGKMRIVDVGWGCSGEDDHVWSIHTESDALPEEFMLSLLANQPASLDPAAPVLVKPTVALRGGKSFVLSQYTLPHRGTVDQLGLHKKAGQPAFTPQQHRLIRLFHVELGRLWRKDALVKAGDPGSELPPRLSQTLAALQAGCSEKEVSIRLGISQHTVHNYVKALHQRLGVTSRGELLSKVPQADGFLPRFSVDR